MKFVLIELLWPTQWQAHDLDVMCCSVTVLNICKAQVYTYFCDVLTLRISARASQAVNEHVIAVTDSCPHNTEPHNLNTFVAT